MKSKTQVVNFFGGPGTGKSTTATGLFSRMKQMGIVCEYVSEFAKEITWEETPALLENQVHVFAEQFRRQWRLIDKVDYIITDSPLLLSSIYYEYYLERSKQKIFSKEYQEKSVEYFDASFMEFNNINLYIDRKKEYVPIGRNQTLDEARLIDVAVLQKLHNKQIPYHTTNSIDAIDDTLRFLNICP